MKKRTKFIVCVLLFTVCIFGVLSFSYAIDSQEEGVTAESKAMDENAIETPTGEKGGKDSEVSKEGTIDSDSTLSFELEDACFIETKGSVEIFWIDENGYFSSMGLFVPSESNSRLGTLITSNEVAIAETAEKDKIGEEAFLILDETTIPNDKFLMTWTNPNNDTTEVYLAVNINGENGYVKLSDLENAGELLQNYIKIQKQNIKEEEKNKQNGRTPVVIVEESKDLYSSFLRFILIEGGIICFLLVGILIVKIIADKNQNSIVYELNKEIKNFGEDNSAKNEAISSQMTKLEERFNDLIEVQGKKKEKVKTSPEFIDYIKLFVETFNKSTKLSVSEWQNNLVNYNPIMTSYDQINKRLYLDEVKNKPSFAICKVGDAFVLVPSCYDKTLNNSNITCFYDMVMIEGNPTGYKIDKLCKVEKEGAYFKAIEQGQISFY